MIPRYRIAIVDTSKAQAVRTKTAEYYQRLLEDWDEVQRMANNICLSMCKNDYFTEDGFSVIVTKLNERGLCYDQDKLVQLIGAISNNGRNTTIDGEFVSFKRILQVEMTPREVYNLGCSDIVDAVGAPFYLDDKAQALFAKDSPKALSKQDFEKMVGMARKAVAQQYKEILLDSNKELRWRGHLETKLDLWEDPHSEPFNLDLWQKNISNGYDLEYQIFDLVRLYKTVDWNKHTVIVFGW